MKVLITGASGFLGTWLYKAVNKKKWNTRALVRPNSLTKHLQNCDLHIGDVTDLASFNQAAKGVDLVFHLAGLVSHSSINQMQKVNVLGTANAIEVCRTQKAKLIYISSVVAVGASPNPIVLNEDSNYDLALSKIEYFNTKKAAEVLVQKATKQQKISGVILNPSTIYGSGDMKKQSRLVQSLVAQGRFPFTTSGGVSVVDVQSVVEACVTAINKGKSGERYILSGENITIKKLFYLIAKKAGVKPPFIHLNNFTLKILAQIGTGLQKCGFSSPINKESAYLASLYHWFDASKAKQELGFSSSTAEQAIENSISAWKQQQV